MTAFVATFTVLNLISMGFNINRISNNEEGAVTKLICSAAFATWGGFLLLS